LGALETLSISLKIPHYASKGGAILQVMSAHDARLQNAKRAPGLYEARGLDGVLRLIASPGRNDVLVAELLGGQQTIIVAGHEIGVLPESVVMALKNSLESDVVQAARQTVWVRGQKKSGYVLAGRQTVLLQIGGDGGAVTFTGKGNTGEQKR
jgi:hypothetical protein